MLCLPRARQRALPLSIAACLNACRVGQCRGGARAGWWSEQAPGAVCRRVHEAEEAARRAPLLDRARAQLAHSLDGWRSYFRQPILPSSLTFVLLFFNVVLSPGWVCPLSAQPGAAPA